MRLLVVSEQLEAPLDEGTKNVAYNIIKNIPAEHIKKCYSLNGFNDDWVSVVPMSCNMYFISLRLMKEVRAFTPDAILYIPTSSATVASFCRARILKFFGKGVPVILYAVQPRSYNGIVGKLAAKLQPSMIITLSSGTQAHMAADGFAIELANPGVDTETFMPVSDSEKVRLRMKYDLPTARSIVLHVGHLKESRNVHQLLSLQVLPDIQVVLVGSTSTAQDKALLERLRVAGIKVFNNYIEHIAEFYQLADYYVFPVVSETACIEVPCSVLEAMACGLPVITTPFGGLPDLFSEDETYNYVKSPELIAARLKVIDRQGNSNREKVLRFGWARVTKETIDLIIDKANLDSAD